MILVSRRERKRSERGKKKRFPQPDSSAVSITSHYLPSGGGGGGGGNKRSQDFGCITTKIHLIPRKVLQYFTSSLIGSQFSIVPTPLCSTTDPPPFPLSPCDTFPPLPSTKKIGVSLGMKRNYLLILRIQFSVKSVHKIQKTITVRLAQVRILIYSFNF